jgi:hypothetical protein
MLSAELFNPPRQSSQTRLKICWMGPKMKVGFGKGRLVSGHVFPGLCQLSPLSRVETGPNSIPFREFDTDQAGEGVNSILNYKGLYNDQSSHR